jgi:hypothetical protein
MFKLSQDITGKDQGKANYANAYIGFGVTNRKSSTGVYAEDARRQNIPVNEEIKPYVSTVCFVSVCKEGSNNDKTIELAKKVIEAGGTCIMDPSGTGYGKSHSRWNKNGEGAVQDALRALYGDPEQTKEGYNVYRQNSTTPT